MDITEFLTACLEEEAAMARAAAAFYDDADQDGVSWEGHAGTDLNGYTRFWIAPHLGTVNDVASGLHINRHDPAHVLREVAAKRKLIELHAPAVIHGEKGGADWYNRMTICRTCTPSQQFPETAWPCDTVKLLASVYADRPGCKEEWKL